MEIRTSTKEIARIASQLKRLVVPRKTTIPNLGGLAFVKRGESVCLEATDLDLVASVEVDGWAEGTDGEGAIVNAGALTRLLKAMGPIAQKVTVATGASVRHGDPGAALKLETVTVDARLNQLGSAEEWYSAPEIKWVDTLPYEALRRLFGKTMAFASSGEARPILNGVALWMDGIRIRSCGTNGHTLGSLYETVACPEMKAGVIVPVAAGRALLELFKKRDTVEVGFGPHADRAFMGFRTPGLTLTTRLVEGTYPNIDQVIPSEDDVRTSITVAREDLLHVLRLCSSLWGDDSKRATYKTVLEMDEGGLSISAQRVDIGELAQVVRDARVEGESQRVAVNARYLMQMVRNTAGEAVELGFTTPERAIRVTGEEDEGWTGVLMPLRLLDEYYTMAQPPVVEEESVAVAAT